MDANIPQQASAAHKASPKDVFLHLLSIVMLYIGVTSFLILVFQIVNAAFPDTPLVDPEMYLSPMRGGIAALVVAFPIYFWTLRALAAEYLAEPERRTMRIRKWMIYLTIFFSAVTMAIDLITLVYNFLEGDLTGNFLLKVVGVLAAAGSVLWYYRRKAKDLAGRADRDFGIAVSCALAGAIVCGMVLAGSPFRARDLRLDRQAQNDLDLIQQGIANYWAKNSRLPASLGELVSGVSAGVPTGDPRGGEYGYRVVANDAFELCTTFGLPSEPNPRESYYIGDYGILQAGEWTHAPGRACFERKIDVKYFEMQRKQQGVPAAVEAKPVPQQ